MFLNAIQIKEEEIISFLELKYPEKEFEYGRLLVGQHKNVMI